MPSREWTFTGGFIRAILAGGVVALVLAAVLAAVAAFAPVMVLNWFLRTFIAFGVAWLIIKTVHHAGGSVGWPFSILAFFLTLAAMTLSLVGVAFFGAAGSPPDAAASPPPLAWLAVITVLPALVGTIVAVWIEHEG